MLIRLSKKRFIDVLKTDLSYPRNYHHLFNGIKKAAEIAQILKNKDKFVEQKINLCPTRIKGTFNDRDLVKQGLIEKTETGEIVVRQPFALEGSFLGHEITVSGPVVYEKDTVIGRSTISGPACVGKNCRIHDSLIRGGPDGFVYIGENCALWDYTMVNRSFVGENSRIHTCNINDSILGPNSDFGATKTISSFKSLEKIDIVEDKSKLEQRIVLANFSAGNKIKIFDPVTNSIIATEAKHFGTVSGTRVSLSSGTIVYPGTIIGSYVKIASCIPLIGFIPQNSYYANFLSFRRSKPTVKTIRKRISSCTDLNENSGVKI